MFRWLRQLRARIRYRAFDRDVRDEIEVHRAMTQEAMEDDGVRAVDARIRASIALGNTTRAREEARRVWLAPWVESVWQDLRYAARGFRAAPGFTVSAVTILFIGIGLNAAVFAVANALLFRPWPVPEADRVVMAFAQRSAGASGEALTGVPPVEYRFLRDEATTVDLTASREASVYLQSGTIGINLGGRYVSGNYFPAIRMPIAVGRGLTPADDGPGRPELVAVLGHQIWQSAFGADPSVVGKVVDINRTAFTIVGVSAAGALEAAASGYPRIWLPLAALPTLEPRDGAISFLDSPTDCCVRLAGRLRPIAARSDAATELSLLHRRWLSTTSEEPGPMVVTSTATSNQPQARRIVPAFGLAFLGVLLVLVLACANVGNLQLARSMARRREILIRLSLGASRQRVVRQLMTESLLLSWLAAAGTFALAWIVPLVVARANPEVGVILDLNPDRWLMAALAALATLTTVLAGVAPALRTTKRLHVGRHEDEKERVRLRGALLGAQVAISLVLLVSAGLITQGVARAASADPGFEFAPVQMLAIDSALPTDPERRAFTRQLLGEVRRLSGTVVGAATLAPLGDSTVRTGVRLSGEPEDADQPAWVQEVNTGYFTTLGITIVAGRLFQDASSTEVMVNETLARRLSATGDVIGQVLAGVPQRQVVGVVSDARLENLGETHPTIFQPVLGIANFLFTREVAATERLKTLVTTLNPRAAVTVRPLSDNLRSSLDASRMGAALTAVIGALALGLAAVGIAGVFSYIVTERTREIGIRMAIGANKTDVLILLVRQAMTPVAAGILGGLLLSLVATPTLRGNIYGLSPYDPATFALGAMIIAAAAVLSTVAPAMRALRIDPALTLRHD